jgi:hypothetical protein
LLGQLINKQYTYEAILCDSRKNEISILNYTDLSYSSKYKTFSEIDIELQYYEEGHLKIKDKNFDLTKGLYLIKLNIKNGDYIVKSEFFFIENPAKNSSNGIIKKSLHCYSYEYLIFNKKKLRGYNQTRKLWDGQIYDYNDTTKGGILDLIFEKLYDTWGIGYINPIFLNVYHTFDFADSTFTDIIQELQKGYNCVILFNNVEQTLSVHANEELGVNRDLIIDNYNYIKSISNEDKFDQIISRLYCYGKDNIGINKYNPTGLSYVESYDYFINNGYFSSGLTIAWNNYKALMASKQGQFDGYITQLETYEASLLQKENEKIALEAELKLIEDALDLEKNTYSSNTSTYDSIYSDLQAKEAEITTKENEISTVQSSINSVNTNITTLQNTLSYSNNFLQEELQELVNFVFEDTLNMSQVGDSEQLYTYGLAYIEKISQVPITFDIDSIDVFSTQEGQNDWNKINIGDFINIDVPELGFNYYPIRLVGFNHNPVNNSLSMTFSNTDKIESDILYLNDIFKLSNKVAVEIEVKKYNYEKYSNDSDRILYTDSILTNAIQAGNNYISQRGFIGSDIGSTGAIQIKNDKIIFSNNDWESYFTLLSGNGLYLETTDKTSRVVLQPSTGFQLDVWNTELNSFRNAIYLGLYGGSPALFIDNGFIRLTRISGGQEVNDINIDPEYGIRIRAKVDGIWQNRLYADNSGNLVAEKLRTFGDGLNYVELESQFVNFWNAGLKKLQFGFQDIGGTSYPYSIWGIGDGVGLNQGFIVKEPTKFRVSFRTSNDFSNSINFVNNDATYIGGGIVISGTVLDCSGIGFVLRASSGRPTSVLKGHMMFDTTLNIPIWYDGTDWVDAYGTIV